MTTIPHDLTAEQREGHACIVCDRSFLIGPAVPHTPVGVVDGGQVFACSEPCAEQLPPEPTPRVVHQAFVPFGEYPRPECGGNGPFATRHEDVTCPACRERRAACGERLARLDTEQPSSLPTAADLDEIERAIRPEPVQLPPVGPRELLSLAVAAFFELTAGRCAADGAAPFVRSWSKHTGTDPDVEAQAIAAAVDKARKHPHRGQRDTPVDVRFACFFAQQPLPGQIFEDTAGSRYWIVERKGLRVVDVRGIAHSARTVSARRGVLLRVWGDQ